MAWRGRHVETPQGWGICVAERELLEVSLDSRQSCFLRRDEVLRSSFCALGTCVQTSYGCAVVLRYRREDDVHEVQLWGAAKCCGKNRAFLSSSALLQVLVALPGLAVETSSGPGFCQVVEPQRVLVTFEEGEEWLEAKDVQCPVAKTLPLVSGFLDAAARVVRLHAGTLERLTEAFKEVGLSRLQDQLLSRASEASSSALRLWDEWEAQEPKQVVQMIQCQAEEVLPKFRGLLDGLVSNLNQLLSRESFDGIWLGKDDDEARCTIKDAVLRWHWGEESDLEIWSQSSISTMLSGEIFRGMLREDGCLEWSDKDVWRRDGEPPGEAAAAESRQLHETLASLRDLVTTGELHEVQGLEEAMKCLSNIAETASADEDVKELASNLESEMRQWQEQLQWLQQELSTSKAGHVLLEGHQRLSQQITQLQETAITPQLEAVSQRGQRFLTRLATDRKVSQKASEVVRALESRLALIPRHLEDWVENLRSQLVERLGVNRALLVDGLRALPLTQEELREIFLALWDPGKLEAQLEASLLAAMAAGVDLTGTELLDCFEGSASFGSIPALREGSGSLISLLKDLGVEVPQPVLSLLEAQAEGRSEDVETWAQALKSSLEDEVVVQGCSQLVEHTEMVVQKLQALKENEAVARAVQQLESEDLERQVLGQIQRFNAEEALSTAEDAWSNLEAREALVNHLKDTCLDLFLKILPSIQIEKVSGRDNECDWEISSISFSDVSFRKEDVRVTLNELVSEEVLHISAWDISAHFYGLKVFVSRDQVPALSAECVADAKAHQMKMDLGFHLSCESGTPELVVSSRRIQMEKLDLWVHETDWSVSALVNALSYLFAETLKSYACEKIASKLDEHMGPLVDALNLCLVSCSPVLRRLGLQQALEAEAVERRDPKPSYEAPCDELEIDYMNPLSALG